MKPFEYRSPASVGEAVALCADADKKARLLAGGTDLLVQMRRGLYDLDLLVDVKQIPELNQIVFDQADGLTIGAAVSCARLCEHADVREAYPALIDAASIIGGTAIRGRATIGGNLCNAAPSGDAIPAMIVLGATCTIAGLHGTRTVPVRDFCIAPGHTVLEQGEMLVSIHFPVPVLNSGACYLRFIPRHEMDIAVAGAGVWVLLSEDHSLIADARVALGAVAPRPLVVEAAGMVLISETPSEEMFIEAARLAQGAAMPITDVRGTDAQRRHLVGVLVRRALRGAVGRAKGDHLESNAGGRADG